MALSTGTTLLCWKYPAYLMLLSSHGTNRYLVIDLFLYNQQIILGHSITSSTSTHHPPVRANSGWMSVIGSKYEERQFFYLVARYQILQIPSRSLIYFSLSYSNSSFDMLTDILHFAQIVSTNVPKLISLIFIQLCHVKFGSWSYHAWHLDMKNKTDHMDLTYYVQSGEWDLVDVPVRRNVIYYNCCDEPYVDVTYWLVLRRKPLYYLFNMVSMIS